MAASTTVYSSHLESSFELTPKTRDKSINVAKIKKLIPPNLNKSMINLK